MSLKDLRNKLEQQKGKRDQILSDIDQLTNRIDENKHLLRACVRAREIIRQVGIKTQQQLSYNISEITSMALSAVFEDPYELLLRFVERRNKTECDILFSKKGFAEIDPFDGGGGAIDVAAFALRVASWSMQRPRSDNVLVLDEPFKHLKGEEANRKMLEMVKEISKKLGIQIIMVSDERVSRSTTLEFADKIFETSITKGITKINEE